MTGFGFNEVPIPRAILVLSKAGHSIIEREINKSAKAVYRL